MATTYALTPEPVCVTENGYDDGALIYNTGTANAYAADVPGGQESGFPIAPGATLTWGDDRPLYLSADRAGTSAVVDLDSSATLDNPATLAAAIISQGLPGDIADAISLRGVPAIDNPQVLSAGVMAAPSINASGAGVWAVGSQFFSQPLVDCSPYQSIEVSFDSNQPSAPLSQYWRFYFTFYAKDPAGGGAGNILAQYTAESMLSSHNTFQIPAIGCYVSVLVYCYGMNPGDTPPPFFFTMSGSYRTVPVYRYVVKNDAWENAATTDTNVIGSNTQATLLTLPASATTTTFYPSYTNTESTMTAYTQGSVWSSTNSASCYLKDRSGNYFGGWSNLNAPATVQQQTGLIVGNQQPRLDVTNHTTTAGMILRLTLGYTN